METKTESTIKGDESQDLATPTIEGAPQRSQHVDAGQDWAEIAAKRVWSILQRESERPLPIKTIEVIIREAFETFGKPERTIAPVALAAVENNSTPKDGEAASIASGEG